MSLFDLLTKSARSVSSLAGGKSAKNGMWIIAERFVSVGISTLITIFSARYLGVENYGILTYGLSFVAFFSGVMKLGLDSIMVNEIINNKKKEGSYLGTSIVLRLISSALSIVAIFSLLSVLNAGDSLIITVALAQALILVFQAFNVLDFWFQSRLKSKYVSIAKIMASLVVALYSTYLLLSGGNVILFALSTTLGGFTLAVVLLVIYKRQSSAKLSFSKKDALYLLSKSHHFITAGVISAVYIQIDRVMIGNMLDQTQLGLYSAALMLCNAWMFLPDSIITSLRPGIMYSKNRDEATYLYKLKRLYAMIFWLSMSIAALITLTAPTIVTLLFGDKFVSAIVITQVAVWYVPFSVLGLARNIWTVSEGNHKYAKYYLVHGLILNITLNLILIPKIGILGAAISTVLTELMTCFISPLFYKKTRGHPKIVVESILLRLDGHK